MSELDGRLGPTWCGRMIFPSGSEWVLMYDPQREHEKDILCRLPIPRPPRIHSQLAARTQSTSQACRRNRPPKIESSLEGCLQPVHPDPPRRGLEGNGIEVWSGYLRRISRPPARCLRTNSGASSDTPGVPIGEVGNDQSRLPALHVCEQLLLACRSPQRVTKTNNIRLSGSSSS